FAPLSFMGNAPGPRSVFTTRNSWTRFAESFFTLNRTGPAWTTPGLSIIAWLPSGWLVMLTVTSVGPAASAAPAHSPALTTATRAARAIVLLIFAFPYVILTSS